MVIFQLLTLISISMKKITDSYSETYFDTDSDSMQKCSTGTDSDGHSDGDSYGQFL